MPEPQDLIKAWAGELQKMKWNHEAELLAQRTDLTSKHRREMNDSYLEAQVTAAGRSRSQIAMARLHSTLDRLHTPGCLRNGVLDCPACDAEDDLEALGG